MGTETFDGRIQDWVIHAPAEDVRARARTTVIRIAVERDQDTDTIFEVLGMLGLLSHEEGCVCGDC